MPMKPTRITTVSDTLEFDQGTIVCRAQSDRLDLAGLGMQWDERTLEWRAPAQAYRDIILQTFESSPGFVDQAKAYQRLELKLKKTLTPRPHQLAALEAWLKEKGCGVVCMPTGAGKSILGVMAILRAQRSALIVVPTIDLLQQWQKLLFEFFEVEIGVLGGGERKLTDITVATYDSALLTVEMIGNRFGMLVFDEVHHLPAPRYRAIARCCLAPFRLGLTATLERSDGAEAYVLEAVGSVVFEAKIHEMVDRDLAPYDVVNVAVELNQDEKALYEKNREVYVSFIKKHHINIGSPGGWQEFLSKASYFPGGQQALQGYRQQKKLSQAPQEKYQQLWHILKRHANERCIIFTDDNKTAYSIGERFILPVLTHKTKLAERKQLLQDFRDATFNVLVTSKVLNEGVDVPEASVAVVFSGSATVREHVQRLGRVLRHRPDKRATLYEIVTEATGERGVQLRRRQHHAYQKPR